MSTPSIDGTNVPTAVQDGWNYLFMPQPQQHQAGDGSPVYAGQQTIEIRYRYMTQAQMDWFRTTILSGARHKTISAAELWDRTWSAQTFTGGILREPISASNQAPPQKIGGIYRDVLIRITNVLPIL